MKNHLILSTAAAALLACGAVVAGVSSPASAAGGAGPYPAGYETASTLGNHTIYRPDSLPSVQMPVVVWGNGGCSGNGLDQQPFLQQLASYGYLVIASGAPGGGGSTTSAMMQASIDWAVSENSRSGSKYYGKLLTNKIAAAGWSCGGLEAYAVSGDSHVATTMIFSSGLLNDSDDYQLKRLDHPIGYFIGGSGDIAYANAMDDWGKLPSGLPAWMGNINVGHGGTYTATNGGEFGRVGVLWLEWQLRGNTTAGANFVGSSCGLCGSWQVQQKNLTLATQSPTPTPTSTTSEPPQQGVVLSSTFEGGTDSWAGRGAASVAASGSGRSGSALSVTGRTDTWNGAIRDVTSTLRTGQTYYIEAWARMASGASSESLNLAVERVSSGTTSYDHPGEAVSVSSGEWVRLSGSYTVPSDASSLQLYVEGNSTGSFLLDDVTVSTEPITTEPTTTKPTTTTTSKSATTKTTKKSTKTFKTKLITKCKTGKNGKKTCRTITRTVKADSSKACANIAVPASWPGGWVAVVSHPSAQFVAPAAAGVTGTLTSGDTLVLRGTGNVSALSTACSVV